MAADKQRAIPINNNFGRNLFTYSTPRIPEYSRAHPIVPKLYVPQWKTDMPNRSIITQNAELGGIPNYEHDENLFLEKREQMHYNVENWTRVEGKIAIPPRAELLRPDFHHETSRYQSELMMRRDSEPA
ncbi:testis-expressed sequence 43 protein-like [Plakobranchus ocellatus]|uniref:Testis-expressed sequence 43 protein-like n=1 Tax=Plakobranchus ocellatus TaxID=259542 RepID=A0AAV4AQZ2_9GAST|nr:testis-expressed sequence 43 protein-like [Plakobranchus ocellatus]